MLVKLGRRSKVAVEKWKSAQYDNLDGWIAAGNNVGFVCGLDDTIVLDVDQLDICVKAGLTPYETYAVTTGSGGKHLYYKVPGIRTTTYFELNPDGSKGVALGEIRGIGAYVVAPPSIHPDTGIRYRVSSDEEITSLSKEEFLGMFEGKVYLEEKAQKMPEMESMRGSAFTIDQVWNLSGFTKRGDELEGPHPNHGSKSGTNLTINLNTGKWYCRRCSSGGGAYLALAVDSGLIDCHHAHPGALYGLTKFQMAAEAERRGLL